MLDLACGTGQLAFGLCRHFERVWAVDQEPGMIRVGRSKAERLGVTNIDWYISPAEQLAAPPGSFELIVAGNAFHRLPRRLVARRSFEWLVPGGCFALLWGGIPSQEDTAWQRAVSSTFEHWMDTAGTRDRVPPAWEQARADQPDTQVLQEAGFELRGRITEAVTYEWTIERLVGFAYSTSLLPRPVLGDRAAEFETDLRRSLEEAAGAEPYVQRTEFACDLAVRP